MVDKDLHAYVSCAFFDLLEPISVLSKSDAGKVLVDDKRVCYNFDKITEKVYPNAKPPSSADALSITNKMVLFTEFKSGFKRKISRETLDYNQLKCPQDESKTCTDFAKILISKMDLETKELLDSLKFKAIESYITLEKKLLPLCPPLASKNKLRTVFCVVIDDYVDNMENTLLELSGAHSSSNAFANVKSSLSRFINLKSADNNDFYYDEIKVLSPYEYQQYISTRPFENAF